MTPSERPPGAPAGDWRGLHPLSFLFAFLARAKGILPPLVAVLILKRGDSSEVVVAVLASLTALFSWFQSRAFRYQLTGDELIVRDGIFARTERHIPYARVQNIVQRRNPLHRAFGVTELRLESAGGAKPEAVMAVITVAAAHEIEALLREKGRGTAGDAASAEAAETWEPMHQVSPSDVLRLGLVTSRGWVVVGMVGALGFSLLPQEGKALRHLTRALSDRLRGLARPLHDPALLEAALVKVLLVAAAVLVAVKLLSVVMAFLRFHGFQLGRRGERLRTEGGLFTRHAASARRDKIQRLFVGETWLARRAGMRWMGCAVAAGRAGEDDEGGRLAWLVPAGSAEQVRRVLQALAPGMDPDALPWRPLHPRAWRRRFTPSAVEYSVLAVPAVWLLGPAALVAWAAALALAAVRARGWARFAAYAWAGEVLAFRSGWLRRHWAFTWVGKGQAVRLMQSPFDRRHGMCSVTLDTAGVSSEIGALSVLYLPEREARGLALELQRLTSASAPPVSAASSSWSSSLSSPPAG